MHPKRVDLGDLATKSNLTAEDFEWVPGLASTHMVSESQQSLNGDSQSIQTDYMIGSRGHQNFINQSRLHLPGSCASATVSSASQEWRGEGENLCKRACLCVCVYVDGRVNTVGLRGGRYLPHTKTLVPSNEHNSDMRCVSVDSRS